MPTLFDLRKHVFSFLAAIVFALGTIPTPAQDSSSVDSRTRPFASLGELLIEIESSYRSLGSTRQQLDNQARKLESGRKALRTAERKLERDTETLKTRKQAMTGSRKWKCNYTSTHHDQPGDCTRPELGGVYVFVNDSGKEIMAPTAGDLAALRAEEIRLSAEQDRIDREKSRLDKLSDDYQTELSDYQKQADTISKQTKALSDPKQVLQEVRKNYSEALGDAGEADQAVIENFNKLDNLVGKVNGSGQCVALVQIFAGLGNARLTWREGSNVRDSDLITFAPAATFVDQIYESKPSGNHAVIVLDKNESGLLVFDQWAGRAAGVRTVQYRGGRNDPDNQAKIEKGTKAADELVKQGKLTAGTAEYYRTIWRVGGYNPSNDADNYSYIKK